MKNSHPSTITRLFMAVFVFLAALQSTYAKSAFSKLVVFGDSLNDRGNMAQFTGGVFPAPPNYVYGRQSNGPVWVEYLAQRLELSTQIENYAVVGALLNVRPGYPTGNVWSDTFSGLEGTDVLNQIFDYLSGASWQADPDALYIVEGGANDFIRVADPSVIVPDLLQAVVMLEMYGAKHIIVVNLADLGKTPRAIIAYELGLLPPGVTPATLSAGAAMINQAVLTYLPAYTFPSARITIADMYGFLGRVTATPSAYGFTQTQQPYLLYGGNSNPAAWLFWDDYHPTTRGHELFAKDVINSLVRTYSPSHGTVGNGQVESLKGLVHAPGR